MAVDTGKCAEAKIALRQALAACGGNTKDSGVMAALENLRLKNCELLVAIAELF